MRREPAVVHAPLDLADRRILITGPTGQVALPVVAAYAQRAEVFALARFQRAEDVARVRDLGAVPIQADLADPASLRRLPADVDYVLNFAVAKSGRWAVDLRANAEGIGELLMHLPRARAVVHFSSAAVYAYGGPAPRREDAPLGDNHRALFPTYSISKIAAETTVRLCARRLGVPATIARLSVPYGDNGGWPFYHLVMMRNGAPITVHPERPNLYNLLHVDDYVEKIPRLLAAASVDTTTVNFGGSEATSIEDWCGYLGELTGLTPAFTEDPQAFGSLRLDTDRMHALIGPTRVAWREGILRLVRALAPDALRPEHGPR
ncbi:MAG: NAD(P)-dependent oxidoreductase [Deltaproteobacteria bacterium]|nr:NAD(P)-dependent oxidoreductase [Deltaproteobacteria bacterium]